MKKFRICMIVIMLAGILFGGIGAGAAFVELSELKYNGTVWYGTENLTKTKLVYHISDKNIDQIFCYTGMAGQEMPELVEDRKVPMDEIWFEIEHNPEYSEPVLEGYGAYEDGEQLREDVHIWMRRGNYDEFEVFMNLKDKILEELKDNKLSSYRYASVSRITVYINPLNVDKLNLMR